MAHAEQTITINRPASVVYNFVLDGENSPKWRSSVKDIQRVPGKPAGVGAVYKQGLNGPGGRRLEGDYEIVEVKPNELIKFQVIAGPARPTGVYQFESMGNSTKVTFTLDFKAKGLGIFMEPMINSSMKGEVAALTDLKKYLESQPQ
jgi:uncharacterized membrane protein